LSRSVSEAADSASADAPLSGGAAPGRDDMATAVLVQAKQVEAVYNASPAAIAVMPFAVLLLAWVQWDAQPHLPLVLWAAALLATYAWRAGLLLAWQRARPGDASQAVWGRRLVSAVAAQALFWAVVPWLFPPPDGAATTVVVNVLVGVAVLGVVSLFNYPSAAAAFATVIMLSLSFWLAFMQNVPAAYVGLIALVIFVMLAMIRNYRLLLASEVRLRLERGRLIEELRGAKQAAEQANAAKSEFLAIVGHEIRNPLNGVLGTVRLLREEPLTPRQRDWLETIAYSGDAVVTLLDDLLDLSKIEAGRLELEHIDFDLRRLAEATLLLLRARAEEKGLALALDIDPGVPLRLKGDPTRLRQVLLNLVSNAVKFTNRGGVTVAVERLRGAADGSIRLDFQVRDTGIGIPEAAQARLFEPYGQADSSVARRFGGTGLGLAICRRIVEAMGGTIGVTSAPGEGSTFRFTLSFMPGEAAAPAEAEPLPAALPALRVLVADDIAINQKVVRAFLEKDGHHVAIAGDGLAAVAAVMQNEFDVVLMDMHMPGMDGLEAARRIRGLSDGARAGVPIVAMTGSVGQGDMERCFAAGMNGFVAKPVDPAKLRAALARVWRPAAAPREAAGGLARLAAEPAEVLDGRALRRLTGSLSAGQLRDILASADGSLQETTERLLDACRAQDRAAMRFCAHALKGGADGLGLSALGGLAAALEAAAADGREDELQRLCAALPDVLERSREALKAWRPLRAVS